MVKAVPQSHIQCEGGGLHVPEVFLEPFQLKARREFPGEPLGEGHTHPHVREGEEFPCAIGRGFTGDFFVRKSQVSQAEPQCAIGIQGHAHPGEMIARVRKPAGMGEEDPRSWLSGQTGGIPVQRGGVRGQCHKGFPHGGSTGPHADFQKGHGGGPHLRQRMKGGEPCKQTTCQEKVSKHPLPPHFKMASLPVTDAPFGVVM